MSAHTPGPWHISGTHPRNIHIGAVCSPMVLASMNDCHTHTPANARLIAAAPDMAQALQGIVDAYGDADDMSIVRCKAALAKAGL